jgi:hypothetical protein
MQRLGPSVRGQGPAETLAEAGKIPVRVHCAFIGEIFESRPPDRCLDLRRGLGADASEMRHARAADVAEQNVVHVEKDGRDHFRRRTQSPRQRGASQAGTTSSSSCFGAVIGNGEATCRTTGRASTGRIDPEALAYSYVMMWRRNRKKP